MRMMNYFVGVNLFRNKVHVYNSYLDARLPKDAAKWSGTNNDPMSYTDYFWSSTL